MKKITVPYGQTHLDFDVEDKFSVTRVELNEFPPLEDFDAAVDQALARPIGSPALSQLVAPGQTVAIIISDMTRASYNTHTYLFKILNQLNEGGVPDKDITVVIATGYHEPATEEEKCVLAGQEVYDRVKIENHKCKAEDLVHMGRTVRGNEVYINHTVATADHIVLTGGICYHTFAGFGGGRKSICPGVAGAETIERNHGLCFSKTERYALDESCNSGILDGNSLNDEMFEIADMMSPTFLVNVVIDDHGKFCAVVAGDPTQAYRAGVEIVQRIYGVDVRGKFDVAILSSGGAPKDINLFQSLKALHNASFVMNPGASVVLCSDCFDGFGPPGFVKGFQYPSYNALWDALNQQYDPEAAISLRGMVFARQMKVYLISSLSDEEVRRAGMIPVHSPEEAWGLITADKPDADKVVVFPCGSLTCPIPKP